MSTTTLTERYIAATIRTLPTSAQGDVRAELAASIADDVEARVAQGEPHEQAERAVLTALGDPDALAAGYADRPLHLIGPRYYLTWWRLLKLLWAIVPVTAAAAVVLGKLVEGAGVGEVVAQAFAVGMTVAVHVAFWTTLVFAVLERAGADSAAVWTLDALPEPERRASRSDLIASLVMLALMAGLLLWDGFRGIVYLDGGWMPVLSPGLWPWAASALLVLAAAEATVAVTVYARGRWTTASAVANTVVAMLALVLVAALLVRGELVSAEFVRAAFTANGVTEETVRILAILLGLGVAGVAALDVADGWRKAIRAGR